MHFHCSANYWPSPGKVIQADTAALAEREYRDTFRVPEEIEVETQEAEALPNGGWRRAPKRKD